MNLIIRWIRAPHLRRRDKRVELLGGYPGRGPAVQIERFEPALGEAERVQKILDGVTILGAESVDEATGDPLDNLINAQGHEWEHRLNQQHLTYRPAAKHRLGQAEAIVEQYERLYEQDMTRLHHAEVALETALQGLSGDEPQPAARRAPASRHAPASGGSAPGAETPRRRGLPAAPPDAGPADWRGSRAAFAPPKVSQAELRQLLAPQDADRVPRWGEPGFRDGTLLAGRPRVAFLHALALLLAAGADVGAFVQVVELVLPLQQDWVIWLVVSGLTSVVLYIAHMVGVMLREAKAGSTGARGVAGRLGTWLGRRFAAFACSVIWLGLGGMAFWIRLTVPLTVTVQLGGGGIGSGIGSGSAASGTTPGNHATQAAVIFLGLYVATGIVAAVGAYFTHNPYRGRYAATIRAYRKATERAAASAYQVREAWAIYEHQQAEIETAQTVLAEALVRNKAFTEQLKQTVRIRIAGLAKDPAVTDAIFGPDHDPYWSAQNGPTGKDNQEH